MSQEPLPGSVLALPLQEQGFHLTKQEFRDGLHLRYGWTLLNSPGHCVCGTVFTADHAMICRHGGLMFMRHNELRDITAELLRFAVMLPLSHHSSLSMGRLRIVKTMQGRTSMPGD